MRSSEQIGIISYKKGIETPVESINLPTLVDADEGVAYSVEIDRTQGGDWLGSFIYNRTSHMIIAHGGSTDFDDIHRTESTEYTVTLVGKSGDDSLTQTFSILFSA